MQRFLAQILNAKCQFPNLRSPHSNSAGNIYKNTRTSALARLAERSSDLHCLSTHLQTVFIEQVLRDFAGDQGVWQIGELDVHCRLLAAVLHLLHHDSRASSSYLLNHRK